MWAQPRLLGVKQEGVKGVHREDSWMGRGASWATILLVHLVNNWVSWCGFELKTSLIEMLHTYQWFENELSLTLMYEF